MAANMDALLRISTRVTGADSIEQLTKKLTGSEEAATRLTKAGKLVGAAFAAVGAADLARRMGDFARSTLEAGEQSGLVGMRIKNLAGQFNETAAVTKLAADSAKRYGLGNLEAAESVSSLYARLRPMGISLEQISSTFIGVNNAAKQAGLSTYDAGEAFRQLGQAMGSGRLQGDELRSLMERMPAIGVAIVDVFNDIARSKGLEQISKEKADVLIKQVKEGEKRQTEIMKEQASLRIEALRNETDKHLGEIDKRYRRQQQIMEDRFEDQDDATRRSNDRQLDATIDGINERAEAERKAIERRFEDRRKIVEDDKTINDALKTQLLRNLDDEKSAVLKAIGDREEAATTQVRDAADDRNKQLSRINRDARQQEQEALEASKQKELDIVKASFEQQKTTLESKLKADIETNKQATAATLANLVASTKVTVGELKQLGADGLLTTDIIVMAMKKLEQIKPPPPTAMQQFTAAMADLRMELGENLLPLLTPGIQLLTGLLRAFSGLPEPVKAVAGGLLVLVGALGALALPLAGFAGVIQLLAGTGAWTAIAGGLGAIAAFLISWPVLLVAAGVAIFLFRDQIYGVIDGINKSIQNTLKEIIKTIYGAVDAVNKTIRDGIGATWSWLQSAIGNVAGGLVRPFEAAAGAIKGVLRSVLQFGANVINGFLGAINQMIVAVNGVAGRLRLPQLPTFGAVSVPSFAGGGYTGDAPRSGGLDGRGGFMAMLHPRETVIDHVRTGAGGGTGITIPIQTGPVYHLADGTDTVSLADFKAGLQAVASGIMGQLRSPAGRMALRGA
jgi:tape measure domain-containing protein